MLTLNQIRDTLRPVLEKHRSTLRFAYLFGSLAEGNETPRSDVDLAVYVDGDPSRFNLDAKMGLHGDCCRALGRDDVDLVVMNRTRNLLLLEQIVRTGQIIWDQAPSSRIEFEAGVLHRAIDFKRQRFREMGL